MNCPYGYFRSMYRKDQIKGIVALILFACIGLSYLLFDKDFAKWVAIVAIVIWLSTIYFLNRSR